MNIRRKVSLSRAGLRMAWVGWFVLTAAASSGWSRTQVILSTDVGNEIDDQWAITYLLTNPDFDVKGIISAHAPSLPAPSAHSTYLILRNVVEQRLGLKSHTPLLEGSSTPLQEQPTPSPSEGLTFLLATAKSYTRENRLTILTIGAATDVASALLADPSFADRVRIIAMGFTNLSQDGGKEFNVQNDPRAWQVILKSRAPVVIGSGDVCRQDLSLSFEAAKQLISGHGAIGAWLWEEYQEWYFRHVKPLRVNDFSKPWVIWDIITLAYVERMTTEKQITRPVLSDSLAFTAEGNSEKSEAVWITGVDSDRLWKDFLFRLDAFQSTHAAAQ